MIKKFNNFNEANEEKFEETPEEVSVSKQISRKDMLLFRSEPVLLDLVSKDLVQLSSNTITFSETDQETIDTINMYVSTPI